MAGTFMPGEVKVRPGEYFNIQKKGGGQKSSIVNGVTAVLFKSDFGPLMEAVQLSAEEGYKDVFGTALTTDAMQEAINGGAKTIIAVRVGKSGTAAKIELNEDTDEAKAVTITAKYPGDKEFTATVRDKLSDPSMRECIIYAGTAEFEKFDFAKGEGEANALVAAMASSKNFKAAVEAEKGTEELKDVSQKKFTAGTNPTTQNTDYSDALALVEPFEINTICVDTEESEVHLLVQAFMNRVFEAGSLCMAVVAEKHGTNLKTRMAHAAAFNDNKMHYVLNAHINEQGKEIDGYQTAARIAGMIGAVSSGSSLTHTVINGFTELLERLTNTEIIQAEQKGCIVLTPNKAGQVWIDSAINTLITPADNQDDGWKKIRRTKTRFELIRRCNETADALVGKIDNDDNGRATVIGQLQGIVDDMIAEGKLIAGTVSESELYKADGDSAWFDIDITDKDSMEHIYVSFIFQFSTNV